jgi:hypothetical protein
MDINFANGPIPIHLLKQGIVIKWTNPESNDSAWGHLAGFAEQEFNDVDEEGEVDYNKTIYIMDLLIDFGLNGKQVKSPSELEFIWSN